MSRTGFQLPDAPPDPPPPTKAPPIEVNPHDEPDAEKFAREKANGVAPDMLAAERRALR